MTVHVPDTLPEQAADDVEQVAPVDDVEQVAPVDDSPRSRRPLVAGALAGLWALVVGIAVVTCLVMLAWAVSPNSAGDSAAAWRATGMTWLAAHLVPLQVSGQPVTLLPIGGLLLGLLLARRSGAWAGRMLPEPSPGEVAWLAVGASLLYGAGGAAVAWLSMGDSASAQPLPAGVVTGVVALLGVLWGISREAELVGRVRSRISDAAWRTWVAGLAAVIGLFAAGALLVAVSLIRHFEDAAGTLADLDAGTVGAVGLTLVDALALPNLAVWAVSLIVGPGFVVGDTGGLSAFGGEVGTLPALPVLAAIPTSVPGWAPVLMVIPVALGVMAGRIRWGRDLPTLSGTVGGVLGLGAVVAGLTAGLMRLSLGSWGLDRLAQVGPVLGPVTGAATGLVLLGFLMQASWVSLRLAWELHRAEQRAARLLAAEQPEAEPADQAGEVPGESAEALADVSDDAAGSLEDGATDPSRDASPTSARGRRWTAITGLILPGGATVIDVRESGIDLREPGEPQGSPEADGPAEVAGEGLEVTASEICEESAAPAQGEVDPSDLSGEADDDTDEIPVVGAAESPERQ